MNKDIKQGLIIGTVFAGLVSAMPTKAQLLSDANDYEPVISDAVILVGDEETNVEDTLIGWGLGTSAVAALASAAAPAVVAHSSGMAIMYSGAGYVAGTIGMAAGTVALLPAIAVGGAAVATGAVIYKYSDEIGAKWNEHFGEE